MSINSSAVALRRLVSAAQCVAGNSCKISLKDKNFCSTEVLSRTFSGLPSSRRAILELISGENSEASMQTFAENYMDCLPSCLGSRRPRQLSSLTEDGNNSYSTVGCLVSEGSIGNWEDRFSDFSKSARNDSVVQSTSEGPSLSNAGSTKLIEGKATHTQRRRPESMKWLKRSYWHRATSFRSSICLDQNGPCARRISRCWDSSFRGGSASFSSGQDGDNAEGYAAAYSITELALDSVVKVFTMASSPNYFLPWQNKPQREITGSGFVISGRRILTNAHVVADQTYVVVRRHGSPCKYRAEVRAVGHECDLAVLQIHDDEFWDGMRTLELGDIPYLQESVYVVGYPQGGDNISVTGGVVSRVEPTQYVHGAAHLMAIQIDAAINPGNSGGPALMEDKVVGVAFQNLAGAENIGYIIPVPIINHFLSDVEETGKYVGFCSLGLTCQTTENGQLREHLKMPPGLTGVLVNKIQPLTDTNKWLKKDDVLAAFDGVPIANDGTVHFRNRERISFDHLVSIKKAGETAKLSVLRNGDLAEFNVKVAPLRPLVPIHQFDRLPSYFIFAGLVFTPLTQPYLHEYGDDWYNTSPRRLCDRALTGTLTKPGEQLVILSQVLMDEINAGYERLAELQVKKVNEVEIQNLKHLKEIVEGCQESSLRFDLDDGRVVVLDVEDAKEASLRILQRHRIPSHTSVDLFQVCRKEGNVVHWEKHISVSSEEELTKREGLFGEAVQL